jgi:hypothetical protein
LDEPEGMPLVTVTVTVTGEPEKVKSDLVRVSGMSEVPEDASPDSASVDFVEAGFGLLEDFEIVGSRDDTPLGGFLELAESDPSVMLVPATAELEPGVDGLNELEALEWSISEVVVMLPDTMGVCALELDGAGTLTVLLSATPELGIMVDWSNEFVAPE